VSIRDRQRQIQTIPLTFERLAREFMVNCIATATISSAWEHWIWWRRGWAAP